MLGCDVQEVNVVDVHEVTAQGGFLVFIKNAFGDIWYHDRLHMLNIVTDCFDLQMLHTVSIDVISHPNIFSKIGRFCRVLLSTVCMIRFIFWMVMFWNHLARSDLFKSQAVYCLFFSSTSVIGERE